MIDSERQQFLGRYFVGQAFEDRLFHTDNPVREMACAWKIMSSPHAMHLVPSFYWRAVGIPMNMIDSNFQGDFDLLFAARDYDPNTRIMTRRYIAYELKTAKLDREGTVSSLKLGKLHKLVGQLQKLKKIGAPDVFFLEAVIIEAGYTSRFGNRFPPSLQDSISKKYELISNSDIGYIVLPIEQIEGYDEAHSGLLRDVGVYKESVSTTPSNQFGDYPLDASRAISR